MKILLLDTQTNENRTVNDATLNPEDWISGDLSSDFMRGGEFGVLSVHGHQRFLVMEVEFDDDTVPISLERFNQYYPKDLLRRAGIPVAGDVPRTEAAGEESGSVVNFSGPENPQLESDAAALAPDAALPPAMLPDEFIKALVGHTISETEPPRFVYSLTILARLEKKPGDSDDDARRRVFTMVCQITAKYGSRAPHFLDDSAFMQVNDGPKIWTPGG